MDSSLLFSCIIITHRRKDKLASCLESVRLSLLEARVNAEIVIVVNGPDLESESYLKWFTGNSRGLSIRYLSLEKNTPAYARNRAVELINSEAICFLDDDVTVPLEYFSEGMQLLSHPHVDVFGGPDRVPLHATKWQLALGATLASFWATASTRARHGSLDVDIKRHNIDERSLILCNLWIKRRAFVSVGGFDVRFFRNEENVLLAALKDKVIIYSEKLFVYHNRQFTLKSVAHAVLRSGYYRSMSIVVFPRSVRLEFFLPMLFVLLVPIFPRAVLIPYLVLILVLGARLGVRAAVYHVLIHFCYGLGFLFGLFGGLWSRSRQSEECKFTFENK